MSHTIHPATRIAHATLTVADLGAQVAFYQDVIGLHVRRQADAVAHLGTAHEDLLVLIEAPGARRVAGTTGLYHIAFLLPARRDLAGSLKHLVEARYPLQGAADHRVSEALYLSDPEGNGLELYRDRPREAWSWQGSNVRMDTLALDLHALLEAAPTDAWTGVPEGTTVGHIHLQVNDIQKAEQFYVDLLGFTLMQRFGHQASFIAAGGYHHHVGVNTWRTKGASPPPPGALGLHAFTIVLPDEAEVSRLGTRLQAAGFAVDVTSGGLFVRDPAGNGLELRPA